MSTVELSTVEKLIIIRHRLGLTAKDAAKRWGINPRTLYSWEQRGDGARQPKRATDTKLRRIIEREEASTNNDQN